MATKTRKKRRQTYEEVFTEAGIIPVGIAMKIPIEMIAEAVQMPVEKINALSSMNS
ncbi:MAG: hypothetical protein FWD36_06245 [Treponema sp.]|nr:hypothetical protein [Treponema sp.]